MGRSAGPAEQSRKTKPPPGLRAGGGFWDSVWVFCLPDLVRPGGTRAYDYAYYYSAQAYDGQQRTGPDGQGAGDVGNVDGGGAAHGMERDSERDSVSIKNRPQIMRKNPTGMQSVIHKICG